MEVPVACWLPSVLPRGARDKVLVARNCHKAVYHALYMNELQAEYLILLSQKMESRGRSQQEQVQESLYEKSGCGGSDPLPRRMRGCFRRGKIAEKCAMNMGFRLSDEAHGAHFGVRRGGFRKSRKTWRRRMIMSLHKTLPSVYPDSAAASDV